MYKGCKIADGIVAYIKGKIKLSQLRELEVWLDESEENRSLLLSLLDQKCFEEHRKEAAKIDWEKGFDLVKKKKGRRLRRRLAACIAAASVAVFLLAVPLIRDNVSVGKRLAVSGKPVLLEKAKAVLTLNTGEKVVLEERDTVLNTEESQIRIQKRGGISYEKREGVCVGEVRYHTIEIPQNADFQLVLSDGSQVWLNAKTKLQFPENFVGGERRVKVSGEAYFKVFRDEDKPFVVETSCSEIRVLGTEFCVKDAADQRQLTTLINGMVNVQLFKGEGYRLEPGQQLVITPDSVVVREVEIMDYTSWKEGYFMFRRYTLADIMDELAQWYGFDCFFADSEIAHTVLTARLKRYDDIDKVLDILARTGNVRFTRNGRIITVGK